MNYRLQLVHKSEVFQSRSAALQYISDIYNPSLVARVADTLFAEPYVVQYTDPDVKDGKPQVILAIGKYTANGDVANEEQYHIIDSAKLEQDLAGLADATDELKEALKKEIEDRIAGDENLQNQVDELVEDVEELNEELKGLHIVKVTEGLPANVKEAYDFVNKDNIAAHDSERILIYKDSALYKAYLGHTDDRLADPFSPEVIDGTGEAALCLIYYTTEGYYNLAVIPVGHFLEESEFKDGLVVDNHVVKVKVDPTSESFLSVSLDGVKLSGIQDAIDASVEEAKEELEAEIKKATVASADKTIVVEPATDGTDIKVNLDNATLVKDANGVISSAIKIAEIVPTEANVKNEYVLVDGNGNEIAPSAHIKTLKDTALAQAYLGHEDDACDETTGIITAGTGDTALCLEYQLADGKYTLVAISLHQFVEETEFGDGLSVNDGIVSVKIDDRSDDFLSVSEFGVRLSGVKDAIAASQTVVVEGIDEGNNLEVVATVGEDGHKIFTINLSDVASKTDTENEIKAVSDRVEALEEVTIVGEGAIMVDKSKATDNKVVSLLIRENEKVLEQGAEGLRTNLSLDYVKDDSRIYLKGTNGVVIGEVDTTDFIKDGMIDNVTFDGQFLHFIFNTAAGKTDILVDVSSLIDIYTVADDSLTYLNINDYKIAAKVDQENGLAGYNSFNRFKTEINDKIGVIDGKVDTLNGGVAEQGSVKHTIDDAFVKFKREGSKVDADNTLLRYYMDGAEVKYYVSNDTADMSYKGENLENVITALSGNGVDTKEKLEALSAKTVTLESELKEATEKIETLENELKELKDNLEDTIKNTVAAILKGKAREITVDSTDTSNITIGFADDAVFGPISLS